MIWYQDFVCRCKDSMGVYSISDVCSENFADKFRPGQVAGFSEDIKITGSGSLYKTIAARAETGY